MEEVSKYYKLYHSPKDRFREALDPLRRRRYQEFFALKNINLEIKKGEILGVVGPNGSGKSTLLKLIAGVIPPSSGRVTVNGAVSAMLELGSGMNPDLSGTDNVYFGGIMLGFSHEEMNARMDEIIAFADIGDFINQPLKTYSSGMKARLSFALAMSIKPDILVVDEVLAVGDDLFKRKCFAKIEELFKAGCTVFFVSHSIPNVNELCTRAILLDKGELILEGPTPLVTRYYHTLLYASPESRKGIRDKIIELNANPGEKEKDESEPDQEQSLYLDNRCEGQRNILEVIESPRNTARPAPYLIPNFDPKTTKKHEFHDVRISRLQIQTLSGETVNALVMNESYVFTCKVQFNLDIDKVKFAMLIQNIRGVAVAGFSMQTDDSGPIKKGDRYLVQVFFKCDLPPMAYFISLSLNQMDQNGGITCLYAIDDAAAFRVQQERDKYLQQTLKMEQTGRMEKINGNEMDDE